jgi:hypothetical protein
MDLKQFLKDNPMIKQAELARLMWPDKSNTNTKLANKLAGTAGQRVTDDDLARAIAALTTLGVNISKFITPL